MDKYLDLTLYLEENVDYTELIDTLFKGIDEHEKSPSNGLLSAHINKQDGMDESTSRLNRDKNEEMEEEYQHLPLNKTKQYTPSFTKAEKEIVKEIINRHAPEVEPRKVIRLNNALILLKKLNNKIDTDSIEYQEELKGCIMDFLEVNHLEDSTMSNSKKLKGNSGEKKEDLYQANLYLQFTEYFIHNKD